MNYKTLFIALFVLFVALTGCSKKSYKDVDPAREITTEGDSDSQPDPIDNFNTVWISENVGPANVSNTLLRTLANLFGYNYANNACSTCQFGRVEDWSDDDCYSEADVLRNYFAYDDVRAVISVSGALPVPAPKDMGGVSSFKITFAANVYDVPREIVEGDAYLRIDVLSDYGETFSVVFSNTTTSLSIDNDGNLSVTLEDECGNATFTATRDPDDLENPVITYYNYPSSYLNPDCYHNQDMPFILSQITSPFYSMPDLLPEGIDNVNDSRGLLFKDITINALVRVKTH